MLLRLTKGAQSRFAAPSILLKAYRRSRVPDGGWTHEEFLKQQAKLTADFIAARVAATSKGARMLAKPLTAIMRSQVLQVIERFNSRLPDIYREQSAGDLQQKAVTRMPVSAHQSLWAEALAYVLNDDADIEIVNTVRPSMQSVADDVLARDSALLGVAVNPGSARVLAADVDNIARQVRGINETTRQRIAALIERGIEDGAHPYEVMQRMRDSIPQIATNRVPTIVRTEMSRVADSATLRAMKDSEVVTHVSVTGCQAIEPGIPVFRGVPTCNIKNVPIEYSGDLRFHINHTGSIIASGFKTQRGQNPDLPLRGGQGSGTWEDAGRPVPAIVQEPPPLPPAGPPTPATPPKPPPAPKPTQKPAAPSPGAPAPPVNPAVPVPQNEALSALQDLTQPPLRRPKGYLSEGWTAPAAADSAAYAETLAAERITVSPGALSSIADDFAMSPVQIRDSLLHGIDLTGLGYRDLTTAITQTPEGYSIVIREEHDSGALKLVRKMSRGTDGRLNKVEHDYFQMPTQGGGVGKLFLRNQLALYDHLGIDRITLYANIDVGGYAWARYGFKVASPEWWKMLKPQITETFNTIKDSLPENVAKAVKGLLRSADPKTVRRIAALQHSYVSASGSAQTLGKKLLLGTDWFGALDLNDPDDYATIISYLH